MTLAYRMETIVAISTPPGKGAIAILRISGPEAFSIAKGVFRSSMPLENMQPRHLYFGHIVDGIIAIDEGLCAIFQAPASYTGENLVEISCHGGLMVSTQILRATLNFGARLAHPGEFTQRAFLNGKMDLTRAEAVMDLIQAQTLQAVRSAAIQLDGALGREVENIRSELILILSHVEASIDFPNEEIEPEAGTILSKRIAQVKQKIDALLATADQGRLLREGVQLVICGPPNVGKSSLLNQLLQYDRAIVSQFPGTTRDTLEENVNLGGMLFHVIDTAGIRHTQDTIELEGIRRTFSAAEKADLILYIVDASKAELLSIPTGLPEDKLHLVWNKIDLMTEPFDCSPASAAVSCVTGAGISQLISRITEWSLGSRSIECGQSVTINVRHKSCLQRASISLEHVSALINEVELVAIEIRTALDAVGEVTGVVDHDEILNSIFSNFCIGK